MPALVARIQKSLGAFYLDLDLSLEKGWGSLFGRSGAGKTTALHCIAGILRPDDGEIRIGENRVYSHEARIERRVRDRGIGLVPPGGALFPHLDVRENLLFGAARKDRGEVPDLETVVELLEIGGLLERRPSEISTGEVQRVAIGRAILSGPRLLLLDEPLSSLDAPLRRRIVRYLARIKEELSIPCLYVTHSLGEVLTLCDHVAVLDGGQVITAGRPLEVLSRPRHLVVADLTGMENILSLAVAEHLRSEGITRLRLGTQILEAPLCETEVGSAVRVGFRAEEVILATEPPGPTSARNSIKGRIASIEEEGDEARVTVDCGEKILARITLGSLRSLGLGEGREVTLILKARSCHYLEQEV
ncbi:MAG: molybdenum ABC transporter ATP-binding protein [Planctomycetota bacterium]|nr:molybdenum ABC transporter ATP-binding protein [Planctomycetota bacterium]